MEETKCGLSKELQKYYTRKGNKIIFSNGMTLNKFAWEMWERLGYESVDPSVLSKVLKGERLFSTKQLEVFCMIMLIPQKDSESLREVLISEILAKTGLDKDFFRLKNRYLFDYIKDGLDKICQAQKIGLSQVALNWGDTLHSRIKEELDLSTNEIDRKELAKLLSQVIIRETVTYALTQYSNELYSSTTRALKEVNTLLSHIKDPEISGISLFRLGSALYIDQKYDKAVENFWEGFKNDISQEWKMLPLREAVICYSKLSKPRELRAVKNRILKEIPNCDYDTRYQMYEGIARAEAEIGNLSEAHKAMELAIDCLNKDFGFMKAVQFVAADLQLAWLSKKAVNKSYIEKSGRLGIAMARKHGYKRHEEKIKEYLNNILN